MGFVRKTTGIDLTGGGAADAASKAAREQIESKEEGLGILREDLAPFREIGQKAADQLLSSVLEPIQQDPNQVLQNPFFQALAREQEQGTLAQRAALGLGGSGGTQDALQRNLLLLGRDFQQQDLSDALAQNLQRFNQLLGASQLGQASAAQSGLASLNTLGQVGELRGVGDLAKAQVKSQQGQQLVQGAGILGGAIFGPQLGLSAIQGAGLGSVLGGGSGVGLPTPGATPGGGAATSGSFFGVL